MTDAAQATPTPTDADLKNAREAFLRATKIKAAQRKAARDAKAATPQPAPAAKDPLKGGDTGVDHASIPDAVRNGPRPSAMLSAKALETRHATPKRDGTPRRDELEGYGKAAPPNPDNDGRPIVFTEEIAATWKTRLCEWLIMGKSMAAFCREFANGPSYSTFQLWKRDDPMFAAAYVHARENCADALADEIVTIADDLKDAGPTDSAKVNAGRLRVDARKWVASKLKPQSYADRLETTTNVTVTHKLDDDARAKALASLLARQDIQASASLPDALRRIADRSAQPVTLDGATGMPIAE